MPDRYFTPESSRHSGEIDQDANDAARKDEAEARKLNDELLEKQQELFDRYGFSKMQRITLPEEYDRGGFGSTGLIRELTITDPYATDELDYYGLEVLPSNENNAAGATLVISLREIVRLNPKLELPSKQK